MDDEIRKELDNLLDSLNDCAAMAAFFYNLLPEDPVIAASVICAVIDKYATRIHMKSSDIWDVFYALSKQVHKEFGDYAE